MNISLDEQQLRDLLTGKTVTVDSVSIGLQDIGVTRIFQIAVESCLDVVTNKL